MNFKTQQYIDLIDWQHAIRVKPSLTKSIREQDVIHCLAKRDQTYLSFSRFPYHSQAVAERAVHLYYLVSKVYIEFSALPTTISVHSFGKTKKHGNRRK